MPVIF